MRVFVCGVCVYNVLSPTPREEGERLEGKVCVALRCVFVRQHKGISDTRPDMYPVTATETKSKRMMAMRICVCECMCMCVCVCA